MRIGVLADQDLASQREEFENGRRADRAYYQIDALERMGHEVVQLHPLPVPDALAHKIEHRLGYPVRAALDVQTAWRCDVVIALLETQGWAYGALRKALRLPPLVTLECWLADDLRRAAPAESQRLVRRSGRLGDIISLTENQRVILHTAGVSADRTHTIPFAVATEFYTPGLHDEREIGLPGGHDVLFVGQDRGRDFDTFLAAMSLLDGTASALVVTKPSLLAGRTIPPNVVLHGTADHIEYRDLLRRAPVVAVPTYELAYPTGQSVAMEAASTGAPVVVTSTTAMREYITPREARMPPVGDAHAFAAALRDTLAGRTAARARAAILQEKVTRRYNGAAMWGAAEPILVAAAGRR